MPTVRYPQLVETLRDALTRPLPGLSAQMGMAVDPRPGTERILDPFLDCRRAGVLVLLYPCAGDVCLALTRRTDALGSHSGQISFPGGSMDPGEDATATAVREAMEELGIDPRSLEILGQLSPLYIPPSGFCIYPVVACTPQAPAFTPNEHEVAEVLQAPVHHLQLPETRREEVWELRGAPTRVPYYAVGSHKVWGATAMVLCELLTLLAA